MVFLIAKCFLLAKSACIDKYQPKASSKAEMSEAELDLCPMACELTGAKTLPGTKCVGRSKGVILIHVPKLANEVRYFLISWLRSLPAKQSTVLSQAHRYW